MSTDAKGNGNHPNEIGRSKKSNLIDSFKNGVEYERKNHERLLSDIKIAIKDSHSDNLKTLITETVEKTYNANTFTQSVKQCTEKSFQSESFKNAVKNVVEVENTTQTENVVKGNKRHWLLDIGIGVASSFAFALILIVADVINKHENKDSSKPTESVKPSSESRNIAEKDTTSTVTPNNEK